MLFVEKGTCLLEEGWKMQPEPHTDGYEIATLLPPLTLSKYFNGCPQGCKQTTPSCNTRAGFETATGQLTLCVKGLTSKPRVKEKSARTSKYAEKKISRQINIITLR
jgi:hypothetical protein